MNKHCVLLNLKSNNKRQFLQETSKKIADIIKIDERSVFDALLERENLGSTGFGEGTAIPHARIESVDKVWAFLTKLQSPIDFDSVDGKPVDLAFFLISPENNGADHLTALAKISRLLKDENICKKIRSETDAETVYALLSNID